MYLIDGIGQLGTLLRNKIVDKKYDENTLVYHTWNIDDKSSIAQREQYNKFCRFVIENRYKRIIFISTNSQIESYYVKYKQLSESFLIENCDNCLVLKFPTLIGKGVFKDFKNDIKEPYGIMSIMTLSKACDIVVGHLNYSGLLKTLSFDGHKVDARIVYDLVKI